MEFFILDVLSMSNTCDIKKAALDNNKIYNHLDLILIKESDIYTLHIPSPSSNKQVCFQIEQTPLLKY